MSQVETARKPTFEERLDELEAYVSDHGRLPKPTDRVGIGRWLGNQRRRGSAQNRQALDERVPGWRGTNESTGGEVTESFLARVASLEAYVAEHGGLPARRAPGGLPEWILYRRRLASPEQRAVLDARVPGWDELAYVIVPAEQRLEQVRAFVAEHGRLPKQKDRPLGAWVLHQRRITTDGEPHPLDAVAPSWRTRSTPGSRFDDRLAEVQAFRASTGALPRYSDGPLGQWLSCQRRRATPENAAKLDADLPGWRVTTRRPVGQSR